ncbi:MAG: hypothetical protein WCC30_00270, partial [Candidatus Dormiibacterota bacterium]
MIVKKRASETMGWLDKRRQDCLKCVQIATLRTFEQFVLRNARHNLTHIRAQRPGSVSTSVWRRYTAPLG